MIILSTNVDLLFANINIRRTFVVQEINSCPTTPYFLTAMTAAAITPAKALLATLNSATATKAEKATAKKELKSAYPMMYNVWSQNN